MHFSADHPHYRRLPLIAAVDEFPNVQHVKDWFKHRRYDDYWKAYGIKEKYPKIKVPAYFITGWYDNLLHENWRNFLWRDALGAHRAKPNPQYDPRRQHLLDPKADATRADEGVRHIFRICGLASYERQRAEK